MVPYQFPYMAAYEYSKKENHSKGPVSYEKEIHQSLKGKEGQHEDLICNVPPVGTSSIPQEARIGRNCNGEPTETETCIYEIHVRPGDGIGNALDEYHDIQEDGKREDPTHPESMVSRGILSISHIMNLIAVSL